MNKRTLAALTTTATAAALVMSACSQAPSATPATSAKICAATSHADAATDPAATALAGAANQLSIAYEAASGDGAPASLVAAGCTLIVGTDSTVAVSMSDAARANPKVRFALVGASFTDTKGNPTSLKNGSVTASQMDAFAEGVDAYNLAKGTSITILGWNNGRKEGTYVDSAEQVEATTADFIAQGADIILPIAGDNNVGAARAVTAAANPMVRLVWTGLTKDDLKGLTRDEAASTEEVMSGQSGAQSASPVVEQVDTQSFSDAFSYIQITDAVRSTIGAPVLTGIVLDYSTAMDTLVSEAIEGKPASTVPVSLASGGVILTGFGAYTPMLSSDLKLGLSDMAGQIETGGMVISTPFDV